jgi:hypothetical protein
MAETTQVSGMTLGTVSEIRSIKEDGTEGNNWIYFYGATANWQTATKHSPEPGAWKVAITSSSVNSGYKNKLKLAEVAILADTSTTITAWVKKDHATNVASRLVVYADGVRGIASDAAATKADNTDWGQLSINFTPDFQCVVDVYLESWYVSGTSNIYVGTIGIA